MLIQKETQKDKIFRVLEVNAPSWVNGRKFLEELRISQYHARIWQLQKEGYKIEASDFSDELGYKYYRLIKEPMQMQLV